MFHIQATRGKLAASTVRALTFSRRAIGALLGPSGRYDDL